MQLQERLAKVLQLRIIHASLTVALFAMGIFPTHAIATQDSATPENANELVRKVVNHELSSEDHNHWMYTDTTEEDGKKKTKLVIETNDGDVSYLISLNDQPLTEGQRRAEEKRLDAYINDPDTTRDRNRAKAKDDQKTEQLFAMLPDAFLFTKEGREGENLKLAFKPNPDFSPRSREAYILHQMEGYVVVNVKKDRLVQIEGRLTHEVRFAGGLLGHLNEGGTFDVHREEIAPSCWDVTHMKVNMNGVALFFHTINVRESEDQTDFKPAPDGLTLSAARDMVHKLAQVKSMNY